MFIDITVPSESDEGTTMRVQAWLKQVGDSVEKNEPLVEMETDKVTLEIESPSDGVLSEILVESDTDVTPNMVIARLEIKQASVPERAENNEPKLEVETLVVDKEVQNRQESGINRALSPSVKRFVETHDIDLNEVSGMGRNQRITLNDVKAYVANSATSETTQLTDTNNSSDKSGLLVSNLVPHSSMRRTIAEHLSASVKEAPHVTAVFEADFSAISAHRDLFKDEFAARGVKLTYTAYILLACAEAMALVPQVNSRWHKESLEIFTNVNIGVGTALGDKGLVVPVIDRVQQKALFDVATALQDITAKARGNTLKASDMQGGTFTVSNHGVSGSLLATPIIINQPESAILGVGKLEKRVVVRNLDGQDVMLIKPMAYVSLTIDHRVIDAHQTNAWLSKFVSVLENWDIEKPI